MGERIKSELTGKEYDISKVLRLVNPLQCHYYCTKNIYPIDIFPSVDYKTGKPLLVYIYPKSEEIKKAYQEWCKNKEENDE